VGQGWGGLPGVDEPAHTLLTILHGGASFDGGCWFVGERSRITLSPVSTSWLGTEPQRDRMTAGHLIILVLIAILIAPLAVADSQYPPSLFENSPLVTTPYGARRPGPGTRPNHRAREPESGGCHHYGDWRYPWPQPC